MNPILLKPESDRRSQVVVMGKPWASLEGKDYYARRAALWAHIEAAYRDLSSRYDLIVIEGAGSPAEINLQATDMANMAVARLAQSPVILVADIDPGGVFAQVVGTLALLPPADRDRVKGIVINKFRGDIDLLKPGLIELEERTGIPVLGVIPMLPRLGLPDEDGANITHGAAASPDSEFSRASRLDLGVIKLPHISNFDDFDPLVAEPGVCLRYVDDPGSLGRPDAIILPGTKATRADLAWLEESGLYDGIRWLSRLGTPVIGLCGGYQMLGDRVVDLQGEEGKPGFSRGLGLLALETSLEAVKTVGPAVGRVSAKACGALRSLAGMAVQGYEIHCGRTGPSPPKADSRRTAAKEFTVFEGSGAGLFSDGAQSEDGMVWGTYLHGIFASDAFRSAWLKSLGAEALATRASDRFDAALDRLADAVAASLDVDAVRAIFMKEERI
jgi:adenosylcobyric acid synthase